MIVLAVDTATLHAGCALWRDGVVVAERRRVVTTHSEAQYKAVARALRAAVSLDPRRAGAIPSTKGSL